MAYREIRSQMFDVLPCNEHGELDLARVSEIQDILDLTLDGIRMKKAKKGPPAPRFRTRKKKTPKAPSLSRYFSSHSIKEGLETSSPSLEEILSTLEEIEQINQYIEKYGLEDRQQQEAVQLLSQAEEGLVQEIEAEPIETFLETEAYLEDEPIFIRHPYGEIEDFLKEGKKQPEIPVAVSLPLPEISVPAATSAVYSSRDFSEFEEFLSESPQKIEPVVALVAKIEEKKPKPARAVHISEDFSKKVTDWFSKKKEPKKRQSIANKKFLNKEFLLRGTGFASAGLVIFLVILGMSVAGRGLTAKQNILSSSLEAYRSMMAAKDSASNLDFSGAGADFEAAYKSFLQADQELNSMGKVLINILEKIPGGSVIGSGASLVSAGEDLAKAGRNFAKIGDVFMFEKISDSFSFGQETLTEKIVRAKKDIQEARLNLAAANSELEKVDPSVLPADMAPQVASLKEKMPPIVAALNELDRWSDIFLKILGHENSKKYLLVFQNSSEARATGGFIGTFGTVDIDEGQIKNLFIDGIYDMDGQIFDNIVPPRPLQNYSERWRIHDSNWFADFPTSAQKLEFFYEKSGGATPDGVISVTPNLFVRLLEATGPIDMPEYGVSLNSENFLDTIQFKVEVDFDKTKNKPKQILADFAPKFLDKLWQVWPQKYQEIMQALIDSLEQKDILFYFNDNGLEKIFQEQGWGGQVLATEKDYLMVVNTNVNSQKTDKVVEQKISHSSKVADDGSITDRVEITRTHLGGKTNYNWYNVENSVYMRVYVPLGSKLISARGQNVLIANPLVDYLNSGFKEDPDLKTEDDSLVIDKNSGTHVFVESGKTVFGNWVNVNPGQTVKMVYEYKLPFRLDLSQKPASYSLIIQKQPGIAPSQIESVLKLPYSLNADWKYPEDLQISGNEVKFSGSLELDRFYGIVFGN